MEQNTRIIKTHSIYQVVCLMLFLFGLVCLVGVPAKSAPDTESLYQVSQLNDKNYTITLDAGSVAASTALEWFPEANITYSSAAEDAYLAVANGKADAFVYGKLYMQYAIASESLKHLALMEEVLGTAEIGAGINPKREDLVEPINAFIAQIKADGTFDDMYERWVVQADDTMPEIPKAEDTQMTIRFGTSGMLIPMNYYGENQVLTGFDIEFIRRLALYLNADYTIECMTFDAMLSSLVADRVDVIVSDLNITEERKKAIFMSDSYMTSETAVLVLADRIADHTSGESGAAQERGTEPEESGRKNEEQKLNTVSGFLEKIADSFDRALIRNSRWKLIVNGLMVTIEASLLSLVGGTILGFLFSFLLRSSRKAVAGTASLISTLLDGIPLLVVLMVLYYIIFAKSSLSALMIGVIGFTIHFANSVAGMLNTGISAVEKGQIEAAQAMGYKNWQVFVRIVFPQAANYMFPQYAGAVIALIQETSILGYITVQDLTWAGDMIVSSTYEPFFPLILTAVIYFMIAQLFVMVLSGIGKKLDPKQRRRSLKGVRSNDQN